MSVYWTKSRVVSPAPALVTRLWPSRSQVLGLPREFRLQLFLQANQVFRQRHAGQSQLAQALSKLEIELMLVLGLVLHLGHEEGYLGQQLLERHPQLLSWGGTVPPLRRPTLSHGRRRRHHRATLAGVPVTLFGGTTCCRRLPITYWLKGRWGFRVPRAAGARAAGRGDA